MVIRQSILTNVLTLGQRCLRSMFWPPRRLTLCEAFLYDDFDIEGDIEVPDHPLVREVMKDCLHEAMDIDGLVSLPRSIETPEFAEVRKVGVKAIEVLGLRDGFTHMEWFRRPDGSVAIGEIAQRPPGADDLLERALGCDRDLRRVAAGGVHQDGW